MNFVVGLLTLLEALAHPLALLGAVLGLLAGLAAAYGLHLFFPFESLAGAQAFLLLGGFVAGGFVGHLADERFIRKK